MSNQLCFVVMGFGKKTDYSEIPRTLDLDRTYEAIIKPAVTACGLQCVRADEVSHSGIIDKPMYEMLLRAELVIADISTANPNALYELGVRHALRPASTIVIKEQDGKFIFDLNHLATLQYKHLGEDIGSREAKLKTAQLETLIRAVIEKNTLDSPVYTYLQGLTGPTMSAPEFKAFVADVKAQSDSLSHELEAARNAARVSNSDLARQHFKRAYDLQSEARRSPGASEAALPDPYIVQQLALHTYKAAKPDKLQALFEAQKVIQVLAPAASTDPETLGIAGAIQKRLYMATQDLACLEAAIGYYARGFELKRDYYNGENYAVCLDWRASHQTDFDEAAYDRRTARKVRERIVTGLSQELGDDQAIDRQDYKWMVASMSNTLRALGKDGDSYEQRFHDCKPATWEVTTFEDGKKYANQIAALVAVAQ
jgi:hypothetical protein